MTSPHRSTDRYAQAVRSTCAVAVALLAARAGWGFVEWSVPAVDDSADSAVTMTLVRVLVVAIGALALLSVPFVLRPRLVPFAPVVLMLGAGTASAALWRATSAQPSALLSLLAAVACAVCCVTAGLHAAGRFGPR